MNVNGQLGQLVETLNTSGTFQNYERAYTEATGMPLTLRPAERWQLPFHGKRKENAFCALMAGNRACTACLGLQDKLTQDAMNKPATRTCAYGLCETAVPVKFGSRTIGFLQTGQVMLKKPTAAAFRRAVVQARKLGVDIGDEQTKRAYFESPVVSQRKLDSVTSLLVIFADHLAMKGNQIMVQTANAESPVIARAKQFIAGHYTEDISLRQVAKTVNTSVFYFCKQFHKSTGLTFTEFVSRIRIEKAKNLLLNPNLHITEIAYAIGFQSLTQFNRTFKKIMGQSPTDYRGSLPAVI
jgi:AraC-like DNA-binding protein/ligand-binding sensor protein